MTLLFPHFLEKQVNGSVAGLSQAALDQPLHKLPFSEERKRGLCEM